MSDEPMSIEEALRVAEQLSPLPQIAHRALQVLVQESRRWSFFVQAMISEDGTARAAILRQPFPNASKEDWDRTVDQAITEVECTNPDASA